jgi:hypothetical protein
LQNDVQPSLLDRFAAQARDLASELESGHEINPNALAQSMGSTLEYILCDLFSEHEDTRAYWVDGVVLRMPKLLADGSIVATGYAWCVEHQVQWQVPAQVNFRLSDGSNRGVEFLKIRIGDAKHATLQGHNTRRPSVEPLEWLFEFDVVEPKRG